MKHKNALLARSEHSPLHPNTFLEELRNTTKNFIYNRRSPGRDMKAKPSGYEAGLLTTIPWRLASKFASHA
jgi:hypothetical protein